MNTVISNIFGGLGNQMFQYAFGLNFSKKINAKHKIDYSYNLSRTDFKSDDIVPIYDVFDIKVEFVSSEDIKKFKSIDTKFSLNKYYYYIIHRYPKLFKPKYALINSDNYNYYMNNLSVTNDFYLTDYWQSEKYFLSIEKIIQDEFQFKKPIDSFNLKILKEILDTNSISIHIRGRDYVTTKRKKYFTCDLNYYRKSIQYIYERVEDPEFFIFSDDPVWAQKFLKIDQQHKFINGNSWNKNSYMDLLLMSTCKHNIIANSSFSWWAGWLNKNPHKIVVAPRKWMNINPNNYDDILPKKWIKI